MILTSKMNNENTQLQSNDDFNTNLTEETSHGFVTQDTANIEQDNPEETVVVSTALASKHMPDEAWSLKAMLERRWLVDTYTWSISDTQDFQITSLPVVNGFLTNEFIQTPFKRFHYFRFKNLKLRLQMQSTKFHQGRLVIFYLPSQTKEDIAVSTKNAVLLQRTFVNPSIDQVVDFNIPWTYFKDFIDLDTEADVLGHFHIRVFNQLATGVSGNSSVSFKLWASFEEPEFHIPKLSSSTTSYRPTIKQGGFNDFIDGVGDTFSKIGGTAGKIANAFVPNNIDGLQGLSMLLDKPQLAKQPEPITRKEQRYTANNVGPDYVDSLTLKPNSQAIVNEASVPARTDEMSLEYLCMKKTNLLARKTVEQSAAVGSLIFSEKIGPFSEQIGSDAVEVTTDSYYALCSNANFWHGSYDYMMDVVCSGLHELRLDFVYLPENFSVPGTYEEALTQYTETVEIRDNQTSFCVRCPFISETPVKKVFSGERVGNLSSESYIRDYWTGTFAIYLSSFIVAPETAANKIDINVFKKVGEDFMFHVPNMTNRSLDIKGFLEGSKTVQEGIKATPRFKRIKPQGAFDLNADPSSQKPSVLGTTSGTVPSALSQHLDDPIPSLRELLKRQCAVHYPPEKITTETEGIATWNYMVGSAQPFKERSLFFKNPLAKCLYMFRNIHGSMVTSTRVQPLALLANGVTAMNDHFVGYQTYNIGVDVLSAEAPLNLHQMFPSVDIDIPHETKPMIPLTYHTKEQTSECKIPYVYMTNTALISQPEFADPFFYNNYVFRPALVGSVIFPTQMNVYAEIFLGLQVTAGFGDETQCFNFVGIPGVFSVTETGFSLYPDRWLPAV